MSDAVIGPLEERYRLSRAFRNASDQTKVTATHTISPSPTGSAGASTAWTG